MLTYPFVIRQQADNYTFTLDFMKDDVGFYLEPSVLAAGSAILFCIVCGALNIATVILYNLNVNGKIVPVNNSRLDKTQQIIESRLTIYAIITFMGHFCMALYMMAMLFCCIFGEGWSFMFLATFNQLPWVSDFSTIVLPSWVLLWASNTIRELIIKELRIGKWPLCGHMLIQNQPGTTVTFLNMRSNVN
ncbi:hypothetical protein Ddc_00112 [Ditylenchus destructor]|nr:hypothetical protein Ddc_00112 [Ditylenchus destructor]